MCEPAMNAVNGATAKSTAAASATPARGSMRRKSRHASTALTAPNSGPTSHSARN
jgi:hypothetical protein